jgi:hypothetical protein
MDEAHKMTAIKFPEMNRVIAKDQPEYQPLPAYVGWLDSDKSIHLVTFCWKLTWRERLAVLFRGVLWHSVMTFNKPLQPVLLQTQKPTLH